jgi:predicted DNA-binding transcriptional regulator AlpA
MTTPSRRMRAPEAAQYVGLSPSTLAKMRIRGDGPPYAKAGRRVVLYSQQDLDAWLFGRLRRSTSSLVTPGDGPKSPRSSAD